MLGAEYPPSHAASSTTDLYLAWTSGGSKVGPRPYQLVQVPYQLESYRLAFSLTGATQPPV